MQAGGDAFGDYPGPEPARCGVGASAVDASVEDQGDLVGAADVEVVTDDLLEEDPPGYGPIQHLGQGELGLHHRDVVAVAGGLVLGGERVGQSRQPFTE